MNRKGFSLLEVIIALGLMGVASIFMMKLRQSQNKSQKTTENSAFIYDTFSEIRAYLQKPGVCSISLDGKKIAKDLQIEVIKRHDGTEKYKVGQKLNGGSYKISKIWFDAVSSTPTQGPDSDMRGEAKLNFEFEKTNQESFGAAKIIKSMEIDFITNNTGDLKDCAALGALVIPKSIVTDKDVMNEAFSNTIDNVSKMTGKKINQDQLNKAIKENPQLGEMMEMLKRVEESNLKAQKNLENND